MPELTAGDVSRILSNAVTLANADRMDATEATNARAIALFTAMLNHKSAMAPPMQERIEQVLAECKAKGKDTHVSRK